MAQTLQIARRPPEMEWPPIEAKLPCSSGAAKEFAGTGLCAHRAAAKDGRIICSRVVEGDNEVSPNVCRQCPHKEVDCKHLRFSLRQTSPSPLIVRYNGRTEIWDDGPSELHLERAACAARVIPIYGPRSCVGCTQRQALHTAATAPSQSRKPAAVGKVVAFPSREPLAAHG